MKYLRLFATYSEFQAFAIGVGSTLSPLVCYIIDEDHLAWKPIGEVEAIIDVPHMVDLGLSSGTLWCDHNMFADNSYDAGGYFAWGEIRESPYSQVVTSGKRYFKKSGYNWNTYKYGTSASDLTKYNSTDGKTVLDIEDDTANDSDWNNSTYYSYYRMPTKAQVEELIAGCTSTWETVNSVSGRLFTSKVNGNSIFIPAVGYYDDSESSLKSSGTTAAFWTSTLSSTKEKAWSFYAQNRNNVNNFYEDLRTVGNPIRPVCNPNDIVS